MIILPPGRERIFLSLLVLCSVIQILRRLNALADCIKYLSGQLNDQLLGNILKYLDSIYAQRNNGIVKNNYTIK